MKRFNLLFVLLMLLFLCSSGSQSPHILRIRKVVIDAGHGGEDPGALGKRSKEKNIALTVALKLGTYIKENFPEVEIIYTRKTDVFIELYRRAQIANSNKADLFISIHCNSTTKPDAFGVETWVLGLNKSQANLEVAKKENGSILFEKDYANQYDGFDPYSPEGNIIFSLYQNAFLNQSLQLADLIQKQFTNHFGRHNRGVKQAGFLVLYKTTMPAALVELGFLSNPQEEDYLMSENGQNQLASAIYKAFKEYKAKFEGGMLIEGDDKQTNETIVKVNNTNDSVLKNAGIDSTSKQNITSKNEIYFRVQVAASSVKRSLNAPEFKGLPDIRLYIQNNTYKYTSGNYSSIEEAVNYQHEVQKMGFHDAFIVAFLNENRITPAEAIKIINQQEK